MSVANLISIEPPLSGDTFLQTTPGRCLESLTTTLRSTSVLVVESCPEFSTRLETHLQSAGIHTVVCRDGDAISALIRRTAPALLLVNAELQPESGWLVCEKLRIQRIFNTVWIYSNQRSAFIPQWKRFSGADDVIQCRNSVGPIVTRLRERMPEIVQISGSIRGSNTETVFPWGVGSTSSFDGISTRRL